MEKNTVHCSALPSSAIEQLAVTVKIRAQLKMRQRHSEPFPEAKVRNYLQKEDFHINIYYSSPGSNKSICFQSEKEKSKTDLFLESLKLAIL